MTNVKTMHLISTCGSQTHKNCVISTVKVISKQFIKCQYRPVCSNLNVQGHFDIEQVLVLAEVTSHLPFGALELIVQLVNCLLKTNRKEAPWLKPAIKLRAVQSCILFCIKEKNKSRLQRLLKKIN